MATIICDHNPFLRNKGVCIHLLKQSEGNYYYYFPPNGRTPYLICTLCKDNTEGVEAQIQLICSECFTQLKEDGFWDGIIGEPPILKVSSNLHFTHRLVDLLELKHYTIIDIQPLHHLSDSHWIVLTMEGRIFLLNLDHPEVTEIIRGVPTTYETEVYDSICIAPDGTLAVVYMKMGTLGVVVDLQEGTQGITLERDGYHSNITAFPVAFFHHKGRLFLIHSPSWNRLDIIDPYTGEVFTPRSPTEYVEDESLPEYYLDYFHGRLLVSPNPQWIVDDGWVWHPIGVITTLIVAPKNGRKKEGGL